MEIAEECRKKIGEGGENRKSIIFFSSFLVNVWRTYEKVISWRQPRLSV